MGEKFSTRIAYGESLADIGVDPKIVVLDADVSTCTKSCIFAERYPERFFNVGIAEANMVGIAAGMATTGLIPFVNSFAMFASGRAFDQIRNSVAYPNLNVKIVGTHAGISVGEDGATHQCVEDLALMRSIAGMTVISPADANETRAAVKAIVSFQGPVYMRLGRMSVINVTNYEHQAFEIGKALEMQPGCDVAIIATGIMVAYALQAAGELATQGINARVINMPTIKPLDKETVIKAAKETGAIVTVEEHNVVGGLGSAVSEVITETIPVPVMKVGVQDKFGRSGDGQELLVRYGLTKNDIIKSVKLSMGAKVAKQELKGE